METQFMSAALKCQPPFNTYLSGITFRGRRVGPTRGDQPPSEPEQSQSLNRNLRVMTISEAMKPRMIILTQEISLQEINLQESHPPAGRHSFKT